MRFDALPLHICPRIYLLHEEATATCGRIRFPLHICPRKRDNPFAATRGGGEEIGGGCVRRPDDGDEEESFSPDALVGPAAHPVAVGAGVHARADRHRLEIAVPCRPRGGALLRHPEDRFPLPRSLQSPAGFPLARLLSGIAII